MVECDVCNVWWHTRCVGIADQAAAPARFLCPSCRAKKAAEGAGGEGVKAERG